MSKTAVVIDYTNHRGERARRPIEPARIVFAVTPWHPTEQWLLEAFDILKGETRSFALNHLHAWQPPKEATVDVSLAKQLQRSMERNARMVNRLQRLEQCLSGTDDVIGREVKTELDEAIRRILTANRAIVAIIKDEEPTW